MKLIILAGTRCRSLPLVIWLRAPGLFLNSAAWVDWWQLCSAFLWSPVLLASWHLISSRGCIIFLLHLIWISGKMMGRRLARQIILWYRSFCFRNGFSSNMANGAGFILPSAGRRTQSWIYENGLNRYVENNVHITALHTLYITNMSYCSTVYCWSPSLARRFVDYFHFCNMFYLCPSTISIFYGLSFCTVLNRIAEHIFAFSLGVSLTHADPDRTWASTKFQFLIFYQRRDVVTSLEHSISGYIESTNRISLATKFIHK